MTLVKNILPKHEFIRSRMMLKSMFKMFQSEIKVNNAELEQLVPEPESHHNQRVEQNMKKTSFEKLKILIQRDNADHLQDLTKKFMMLQIILQRI